MAKKGDIRGGQSISKLWNRKLRSKKTENKQAEEAYLNMNQNLNEVYCVLNQVQEKAEESDYENDEADACEENFDCKMEE